MTRRRNYRNRLLGILFLFVMVATFVFVKNLNNQQTVDAANLANFDPGFIISDYVMGDYNSMSEQEIQAFLTKKNSCSNRNREYYEYLSQNTNYIWHWKDDHFVCLSEELFGDGEIIGEGESAAHIIWQAAQDYQINPRVLIVLLEKETSLITDKIPNNGDYRKATGYGCPDFAACSEKYYGFKNQVRNAANMFHIVLTGGWTNYPLGVNYIQYNPNKDCGGSEVNIRSLATSALYRYTPYQPNEGALAAGYGTTATCGAYGNRNFYLYFNDWFGDSTEIGWYKMETPRVFSKKENAVLYDGTTKSVIEGEVPEMALYTSKIVTNDQWCLRSKAEEAENKNRCVLISDLDEIDWTVKELEVPRYYKIEKTAKVIESAKEPRLYNESNARILQKYIELPDDKRCFTLENDKECVIEDGIALVQFEKYNLERPRYFNIEAKEEDVINYDEKKEEVKSGRGGGEEKQTVKYFEQKVLLPDGEWCLVYNDSQCVRLSQLSEMWQPMQYPRNLITNTQTYKINIISSEQQVDLVIPRYMVRKYVAKAAMKDGSWCLMTEYDYERNTNNCILDKELDETNL